MRQAVETRSIKLGNGRKLAFDLYGQPEGRPIYFFHGFPSSRLLASFLHGKARKNGVCLIAPDRPGFGQSSPARARTLTSWAMDVAELANALGHERFDVIGVSCGGPYALATAHELPERVGQVGLFGGMGPMDVPAIRTSQLPVLTLMFTLARISPWLITPLLMLDKMLYRSNPQKALKMVSGMLSQPDQEVLRTNPDVADGFISSMAEAYAQGIGGAMQEAEIIATARPFLLKNITSVVHVFQGDHDRHVPLEMGMFLAENLPNGRLHKLPNEGHLSVVWNQFDLCISLFKKSLAKS